MSRFAKEKKGPNLCLKLTSQERHKYNSTHDNCYFKNSRGCSKSIVDKGYLSFFRFACILVFSSLCTGYKWHWLILIFCEVKGLFRGFCTQWSFHFSPDRTYSYSLNCSRIFALGSAWNKLTDSKFVHIDHQVVCLIFLFSYYKGYAL